jgi:hypothetical protein
MLGDGVRKSAVGKRLRTPEPKDSEPRRSVQAAIFKARTQNVCGHYHAFAAVACPPLEISSESAPSAGRFYGADASTPLGVTPITARLCFRIVAEAI